MKLKKLMAAVVTLAMAFSVMSFAVSAENAVAKVGEVEYATIDEALAAWTNGTTLTLLSDVTLPNVVELSSTEKHVLDLGTYTMTAATNKSAISIIPNGRTSASYALDIYADAENPGGIYAKGASCIYSRGKSGLKDRPIIRIYGGNFSGSYAINHSGSNGTNCPQFWIYGGTFNQISTNRAVIQISGGTFNQSNWISPDSSAYTRIDGGRFYNVNNNMGSALNAEKWTYGTAKGVFDVNVYVDEEGYYVVTKDELDMSAMEASAPVASNSTLVYSKANTEGLYYMNGANAFAANKKGTITLYAACDADVNPSGALTVDCTAENAAYSGNVKLTNKNYSFTVMLTDEQDYTGTVTTSAAGYKVVKTKTEENGIITVKHTLSPVEVANDFTETDGVAQATTQVYTTYDSYDIPVEVTVSLPADSVQTTGSYSLNVVAAESTDEEANFLGEDAFVYDITIVDENGNKVEFTESATVTLKYPGETFENKKVYYIDDNGTYTDMNATYDPETKTITFVTTHFSKYAIAGAAVLEDNITDNVYIQYKATANPNVYEIYAVAEAGKMINRFSSTQLKFSFEEDTANATAMAYTLEPAADLTMSGPDADGYMLFNYDGEPADTDVVTEVLIATVTFEGYGKFVFSTVDDASKAMLHTAKILDNIVVDYDTAASKGYDLVLTESGNDANAYGTDAFGGVIDGEFTVPTSMLTINVIFPNAVTDKEAAYQDMTVTIVGGTVNKEISLGDATDADAEYVITEELPHNTTYVVTVSGAGYRTARYSVKLTADKELTFWNNVMTEEKEIEKDNANSLTTKNFLAGDIVKDNQINIYDLSAVVSYFGTTGLSATENPAFAKYDLNRDGKIDSKDVAYVLVSWNN